MKKLAILLLLIFPLVMAKRIEIYSEYTTHPSFICPEDAERCELYMLVDAMSRNITPPKLVKQCSPGLCMHANDVGSAFGFRLLPGDVFFGAGLFKGYKIVEGEDVETTTTVTTTTTTTIPTTTLSCIGKPFLTCKSLEYCVWYGDPIMGYCSFPGLAKTTEIATTKTTATTTQTTTTTIFSCLVKGEQCSSDSDCCSQKCQRRCLNPSILGICLFSQYISRCQ